MEETGADSRLSTNDGLTSAVQLILTCWSSILVRKVSTFLSFQPSCVRMNDGSRLSFTTRDREKITSSAVSGLPLAKVAFESSVKVRLRLSAEDSHEVASVGLRSIGLCGSDCTKRW